jgi:hypothetical protein
MTANTKPIAFEVVDLKTKEVVHKVDLSGEKSESTIERVERGLLMRTDLDRFFVRPVLREVKS